LRLGLTGGIGSGKSTVAKILLAFDAQIIDADAISRATTQSGGAAIPEVARVFGSRFITPDGALDRPLMRDHVFAHDGARSQLESIVHPLVAQEMARQVRTTNASCLIFDVPLLVESAHWRQQLDCIWVVDCTVETQVARVQQRSGWSQSAVQAVIASQCTRPERLGAADATLYNDGISLAQLHALVKHLALKFGL
jgi:dephospho-CoA kinase